LVFVFAIACALGFMRWVYVKAELYEFLKTNPWPSPFAYIGLVICMGAFIFIGIWCSCYYGHRIKKTDCQNQPLKS